MPKEVTYKRSDGEVVALIPEPFCEYCCKPISDEYAKHRMCYHCNKRMDHSPGQEPIFGIEFFQPYSFKQAFAVGLYITETYDNILSKEILALKKGDLRPLQVLVECMVHVAENRFDEILTADVIAHVPKGSKTRPYDQGELLATQLSSKLSIPRTKGFILLDPSYQARHETLGADERWESIRGKVSLNDKIKNEVEGKTVLLVDDTFVTGSITNECSKVLIDSGAENVYVFAVGRAVSKKHLEFIEYSGRL